MYDLEVSARASTTLVRGIRSERDVALFAGEALAAWGLPAPDALADGSFAAQLAETGEYACDVDWARVTVKRAEQS